MGKVKLDIDKIAAGMQLAEPIANSSGVTLMPAGIRLTPMFILRLKKWNITELEVMVDDDKADAPKSAESLRRRSGATSAALSAEQRALARSIATEVSRWFVNVRDNALMTDLYAAVVNRLVSHGREGLLNRLRATNIVDDEPEKPDEPAKAEA